MDTSDRKARRELLLRLGREEYDSLRARASEWAHNEHLIDDCPVIDYVNKHFKHLTKDDHVLADTRLAAEFAVAKRDRHCTWLRSLRWLIMALSGLPLAAISREVLSASAADTTSARKLVMATICAVLSGVLFKVIPDKIKEDMLAPEQEYRKLWSGLIKERLLPRLSRD